MRKIIHIDMDCFFAAVEVRDNPELKGRPVAVGGSPRERGVISTANYEARVFGVHSALSSAEALKRCPRLVLLSGDIQKYKKISLLIYEIFYQYSDIVEKVSIDEAFIDITVPKKDIKTATLTAKAIRLQIYHETGLTASAGIAPNPFLAKVASDWNKPNGQFTITPEMVENFMRELSVRKIPGVGNIFEKKLSSLGIFTCGDLQCLKLEDLVRQFGKWGLKLSSLARGIDDRALGLARPRKSVSVEKTFIRDLFSGEACVAVIPSLVSSLNRRANSIKDEEIKNIFLKLKFSDFKITKIEDINLRKISVENYSLLMHKILLRSSKSVRLVGVGINLKIKHDTHEQLDLSSGKSYEDAYSAHQGLY